MSRPLFSSFEVVFGFGLSWTWWVSTAMLLQQITVSKSQPPKRVAVDVPQCEAVKVSRDQAPKIGESSSW